MIYVLAYLIISLFASLLIGKYLAWRDSERHKSPENAERLS